MHNEHTIAACADLGFHQGSPACTGGSAPAQQLRRLMYGFASPMHQSQAALVQALVHEERITSQQVAAAMAALDRRHFLNPDDPELFPSAYVVRLHSASCLIDAGACWHGLCCSALARSVAQVWCLGWPVQRHVLLKLSGLAGLGQGALASRSRAAMPGSSCRASKPCTAKFRRA